MDRLIISLNVHKYIKKNNRTVKIKKKCCFDITLFIEKISC